MCRIDNLNTSLVVVLAATDDICSPLHSFAYITLANVTYIVVKYRVSMINNLWEIAGKPHSFQGDHLLLKFII